MKVFLFVVIIASTFLYGCEKEVDPSINEKYFFRGIVDNNPVSWEVKIIDNLTDTSMYNARATYYYGQSPTDCATTNCYDVKAGIVVHERNRGNAIDVVFLQATKTNEVKQLIPLFTLGPMPYGNQRTSPYTATQNGIIIKYTEGGRIWTSEKGDQTGSTFESVEFKEASIDKNIYSHVWRARFSCKVYFDGLPPKTLQNCEIYGPAFYQ